MITPISDGESSGHQMYAPKRLREQTRIPPAPQLRVTSPGIFPSHAQVHGDQGETSGFPSSGEDSEDKLSRRLYEPELASEQPDLRGRVYPVVRLISWVAIVAACTGLIVLIAIITKPLWSGLGRQPPLQASLSDRLGAYNAPADPVTVAATSGAHGGQRASTAGSARSVCAPVRQSRTGHNRERNSLWDFRTIQRSGQGTRPKYEARDRCCVQRG